MFFFLTAVTKVSGSALVLISSFNSKPLALARPLKVGAGRILSHSNFWQREMTMCTDPKEEGFIQWGESPQGAPPHTALWAPAPRRPSWGQPHRLLPAGAAPHEQRWLLCGPICSASPSAGLTGDWRWLSGSDVKPPAALPSQPWSPADPGCLITSLGNFQGNSSMLIWCSSICLAELAV